MGSQINKAQLDKILAYTDAAKKEGDRILCGGTRLEKTEELKHGFFMAPTLIETVNSSKIAQEEIFGPVAAVIKFRDEQEVINKANDSVYGLGGAVRVAREIRTGRMWVNTYNQIPEGSPFGGYKQSDIGRETHKMILDAYSQRKNIMINLHESPSGFYPE